MNNDQQIVSREMFHARIARLKRYSEGSKLGHRRRKAIRERIKAIADKEAKHK